MSTTIDENITTEITPRNISELLKLNSYQEMSDEEIELIIDYKCAQAITSAEFRIKTEILVTEMEDKIAQNKKSVQKACDVLESLLNRKVANDNFVQPETVTPRSIGE